LDGARVLLSSKDKQLVATSDLDGHFRFDDLSSGDYTLSASRPPLVPEPPSLNLSVPANGCVAAFPILQAHAVVSGTVRKRSGAPARRMDIELVRQEDQNNAAQRLRTPTDDAGHFDFEDLPEGDYLLGNEIGRSKPYDSNPFPTYYYPNSPDRQHATSIHLAPFERFTNANLTLPKPDSKRRIRVKVVWPDGTAPGTHLLQIVDEDELLKKAGTSAPGEPHTHGRGFIRIAGYAHRSYHLHAIYWIDDEPFPESLDPKRIALSDDVKIEPGYKPIRITLILSKKDVYRDPL
jgi:hypothetical protein